MAILGKVTTPDGHELVLHQRDGIYTIRINGLELMSSRAHISEEALAELVLSRVVNLAPRVLVGGLGMGFTLRAVLDRQPPVGETVVAEVFPAVVRWNRNELAHLARSPLNDERVSVVERDVGDVIGKSPNAFDAIILDVDNGPASLTLESNSKLYASAGLNSLTRSLRLGGVVGIWSADPLPEFSQRLLSAGFQVTEKSIRARNTQEIPQHTVFVATRPTTASS